MAAWMPKGHAKVVEGSNNAKLRQLLLALLATYWRWR